MKMVTREEYIEHRAGILKEIAEGALFIYPSDTTYRIGCDATNEHAVHRLRKLKQTDMPFSIVAPSKQWIRKHCHIDEQIEDTLDLLPGSYLLRLALKKKDCVAPSATSSERIGVRIPQHWMQEIASLLDRPIISTSANIAGESSVTQSSDIHPTIRKASAFCLYEGKLDGSRVQVIEPHMVTS